MLTFMLLKRHESSSNITGINDNSDYGTAHLLGGLITNLEAKLFLAHLNQLLTDIVDSKNELMLFEELFW